MTNEVDIIVEADGTIQFIYADDVAAMFADDEQQTRRASDVEPYDGSGGEAFAARHSDGTWWTSDMARVGGPVLGPFRSRDEALQAEVAWLRERMIAAPLEVD